MTTAATMAASISRTGFLRRPRRARRGHREWLHFSIADGLSTFILNTSVTDDARLGRERPTERGRIVALLHDGEDWCGGTEELAPSELDVRGGTLHMRLGRTVVDFVDGAFHVTGAVRDAQLSFELVLRPDALPSVASEVALARHEESINWAVVPALRASGWVETARGRRTFADAAAYHDHNWGYFSHRDFAWQWGYALPSNPADRKALVVTRLLDGMQSSSIMQALLLWKDGRQHRVFRAHDIELRSEGLLRPDERFIVPQRARLLARGTTTDIPRRLSFTARGRGDAIEGAFLPKHVAEIVVPNEHDLGTTLIREVVGDLRVDGVIRGESFTLSSSAVFEWLGRGA